MYDAKELIRNHGKAQARVKILKEYITKIRKLELQLCDSKIDELALSSKPLDGMPSARRHGSRTEYVAISFREIVRDDLKDQGYDLEGYLSELEQVESEVALYDAAIDVLTEVEGRLILLHYEKGLPFRVMSEMDLLPNRTSQYSESSLKRIHRDALCKVAAVLCSLPSDVRSVTD